MILAHIGGTMLATSQLCHNILKSMGTGHSPWGKFSIQEYPATTVMTSLTAGQTLHTIPQHKSTRTVLSAW